MKKFKRRLWSITPYLIEIISLNFGFGGNYTIALLEVLTRGQEDKGRESASLLSMTFHRMYSGNKLCLYLWSTSILFKNFQIMKRLC